MGTMKIQTYLYLAILMLFAPKLARIEIAKLPRIGAL
jgi:hypothetical protein